MSQETKLPIEVLQKINLLKKDYFPDRGEYEKYLGYRQGIEEGTTIAASHYQAENKRLTEFLANYDNGEMETATNEYYANNTTSGIVKQIREKMAEIEEFLNKLK
jgi:antitoxin component YwqK of YwqJK toxin-antitoxin module